MSLSTVYLIADDPDAYLDRIVTSATGADLTFTPEIASGDGPYNLTGTWQGTPAPTRTLRIPVTTLGIGTHHLYLRVTGDNDIDLGWVKIAERHPGTTDPIAPVTADTITTALLNDESSTFRQLFDELNGETGASNYIDLESEDFWEDPAAGSVRLYVEDVEDEGPYAVLVGGTSGLTSRLITYDEVADEFVTKDESAAANNLIVVNGDPVTLNDDAARGTLLGYDVTAETIFTATSGRTITLEPGVYEFRRTGTGWNCHTIQEGTPLTEPDTSPLPINLGTLTSGNTLTLPDEAVINPVTITFTSNKVVTSSTLLYFKNAAGVGVAVLRFQDFQFVPIMGDYATPLTPIGSPVVGSFSITFDGLNQSFTVPTTGGPVTIAGDWSTAEAVKSLYLYEVGDAGLTLANVTFQDA